MVKASNYCKESVVAMQLQQVLQEKQTVEFVSVGVMRTLEQREGNIGEGRDGVRMNTQREEHRGKG